MDLVRLKSQKCKEAHVSPYQDQCYSIIQIATFFSVSVIWEVDGIPSPTAQGSLDLLSLDKGGRR